MSSLVTLAGHITSRLRASKYFTLAFLKSPELQDSKLLYLSGSTWYNFKQLRWWHMACLGKVHITTNNVIMPCHLCYSASKLRASGDSTLVQSNSPKHWTPEPDDLLTCVSFRRTAWINSGLRNFGIFHRCTLCFSQMLNSWTIQFANVCPFWRAIWINSGLRDFRSFLFNTLCFSQMLNFWTL